MPSEIHEQCGYVSCDEATEIARRYNASHFRKHADRGERARYSIPANPMRDDDLRLGAFIDRMRELETASKNLLEELDKGSYPFLDFDTLRNLLTNAPTDHRKPGDST